MGTWGTGISSNDVYEDINCEFFELYNQGMEVSAITEKLIKENQDLIESLEDQNNFWITIAKSQWECKALDAKIYNRIKDIVESEKDIELWKELNVSKSDLTKRRKVLNNFLKKISTEKRIARKRKVIKLIDSIFEKGDCLAIKLNESEFGGIFILEAEKKTEFGLNLICLLDIKQTNKPIISDFEKAKVIVTKSIGYDFSIQNKKLESFNEKIIDNPEVCWYYASMFKKSKTNFELIGNLKVNKLYNSKSDFQCLSQWDNIKSNINFYYENIKTRKGFKKLRLKQLTKNYWYQQWL